MQWKRHRSHGFNPWIGKNPWRRKWQLTPVSLPGKSHGERSLVGYSSVGFLTVGHNWVTKQTNTFVVVYFLSHVQLIVTSWTIARQASLSFTVSQSLFKLISADLVMPFNHLILCHPLLLLPSIFPSIRVFFNESAPPIRWPKYWSFSFSISPSNQYSGLISFRIDWFDVTAVQRTLKSLLQKYNSKTSILQHSAFFMVQLSIHDYWKNHSFDKTALLLAK